MLAHLRRHRAYYFALTAAAFAFRLFWIFQWGAVNDDDTFVYGELAKNLLQNHIFGTADGAVHPILYRLPGYPAFLAAIWAFTGVDHYNAVMFVQMFLDVGTCFVVTALALRVAGERAARIAFALTALCPFLVNYVAVPLTETPAIFFTAAALWLAAVGFDEDRRSAWIGCGIALACGILLRPDGGVLLIALGAYMFWRLVRLPDKRRTVAAGVLVAVIALAPLVPWTIRNWRVFHVFQPLAPRYANDPGEFTPHGFNRWVKTWLVDYVSVEEVYWHVGTEPIDIANLPARAFDSPAQRDATVQLIAEHNQLNEPLSQLDPKFDALARDRIAAHPLRYYVWLPFLRTADMWLRPRVEKIDVNDRWWEFSTDLSDSLIGTGLGVLNLFYLVAALVGWWRGGVRYAGLFIVFFIARSLLLATMENPETRYTLECFPAVIVLAAAAFNKKQLAISR